MTVMLCILIFLLSASCQQLSPIIHNVPYTRCLYEIWHTFEAKGARGLRVLTSSVEMDRLQEVRCTREVLRLGSRLSCSGKHM